MVSVGPKKRKLIDDPAKLFENDLKDEERPTLPRYSILVTVQLPSAVSKHLKDLTHKAMQQGVQIDIASWEKDGPMPAQRLKSMLSANQYHGILCTLNDQINREVLDLAPQLKVVSTMSVGYDHIDIRLCKERGISVGHTPGVLTDTCADLTLALMLAGARRLGEARDVVKNGKWVEWRPLWMCGKDLHHSTVGIVGLGRIGTAVARRLCYGFDCKLLYCGPREKPEAANLFSAEYVSFEDLLNRSDFVVCMCPLNGETKHMFNADAFARMKKDAVFVNTARGSLVDKDALYGALKDGAIGAAALDVTDPEPFPANEPLLSLPNCIIMPHIGSASRSTRLKMATTSVNNLISGLVSLAPSTPSRSAEPAVLHSPTKEKDGAAPSGGPINGRSSAMSPDVTMEEATAGAANTVGSGYHGNGIKSMMEGDHHDRERDASSPGPIPAGSKRSYYHMSPGMNSGSSPHHLLSPTSAGGSGASSPAHGGHSSAFSFPKPIFLDLGGVPLPEKIAENEANGKSASEGRPASPKPSPMM